MARDTWARSGTRRPATVSGVSRGPRPDGSWSLAVRRARESWDELTGGPELRRLCDCGTSNPEGALHDPVCASLVLCYSDTAAAAILATALGLWSDSALRMGEPADD